MTRLQVTALDRRNLQGTGTLLEAITGLAARIAVDQAPTHVVIVRPRSVDLLDPRPLREAGIPFGWQVAGFTDSCTTHGEVEALGLLGRARQGPGGVEHAMAFLEWPDDRWWWWRAPFAGKGVHTAKALVRDATLGDPMPDGLGRWWLMRRRDGPKVQLEPMGMGGIH